MHRLRHVFVLFAITAMAVALTPKDIAFHEGSIVFIGDSITLGGNASGPSKTFVSLVIDYLADRTGREQRNLFLSFDPSADVTAAAEAMQHDRRFVIVELGVHAVINESISADEFRQLYASLLDCVTGGTPSLSPARSPGSAGRPSTPSTSARTSSAR